MSDPAPEPTAQVTSNRLRFSGFSGLTKQTVEILESSSSIETGQVSQYGGMTIKLILSDKHSYRIPEIITSKETLHFLGFTPFEVERIWSDITPLRGIYKWVEREFIEGILSWIAHKITNIKWLDDAGELKSPKELLDYLGLRNNVQLQIFKLTSMPERGGCDCSVFNSCTRSACSCGRSDILRAGGAFSNGWMNSFVPMMTIGGDLLSKNSPRGQLIL